MFGQVSMLLVDSLKNRVDEKFKCNPIYPEISKCTTEAITDFSLLFDEMYSEHSRFKAFENYGTLVPPETIKIGERKEYKVKDDYTIYNNILFTFEFFF